MTSAALPVVLENDPATVMFNNPARQAGTQALEGLGGGRFSSVDKSWQGSHSLFNANVCEMFRGYALNVLKARISRPGGWAAEVFFGASVAPNNHKIGVNP
ncbi:hypothetical protein DENIT_80109 [Pseudomonas veronii]|jgi:hypothetical protein|nr:hypothetical protein DENIT_80109 [Pseudomonas veronii]